MVRGAEAANPQQHDGQIGAETISYNFCPGWPSTGRGEKAHGAASAPNPPGQDSLRPSRIGDKIKGLLKTPQVPLFFRESKTRGLHNCLMDRILLALRDKQQMKPLEIHERSRICCSTYRRLIEHHGIELEAPDGSRTYPSHGDSVDAICNHRTTSQVRPAVHGQLPPNYRCQQALLADEQCKHVRTRAKQAKQAHNRKT